MNIHMYFMLIILGAKKVLVLILAAFCVSSERNRQNEMLFRKFKTTISAVRLWSCSLIGRHCTQQRLRPLSTFFHPVCYKALVIFDS